MARRAGIAAFALSVLMLLPCAMGAQVHTVAITVDDLPLASSHPQTLSPAEAKRARLVNRKILRTFARQHIPATGFVIEQRAEQLGSPASTKILRQWLAPSLDLGNHLYSHPDVNTLSVEQVEQEIIRGEATLSPLLKSVSRHPEFLRFPYNHTGDTQAKHDGIAAFMAAHGYRLAPCTIENDDWEFNAAYELALERRDARGAARIRAAYIAYTETKIDWYTALDKQVFGYEPPHIMLLHDNALNADAIGKVLSLFAQRRYTFVSLAEATKDPAYSVPETYVTSFGPMWGYRWAQELHVKVTGRDEPEPPAWVAQYGSEHGVDH